MAKNDALINHEVAFFEVQDQIALDTLLQNLLQVGQAICKIGSVDGEIIHKHLHRLLNELREDRHHTTLERCRCIAQAERHPPVGKCPDRASESCLLLILQCYWNLMKSRETIKEAIVGFTR